MATFLLIHGAMHGGWCWRDVRRTLLDEGHDVHTPSLTGQGDRRHLLNEQVGVSTHVRDVVEILDQNDLESVHLVLHSYAGVLAGPVADAVRERLASLTYAGAFLADPGECLLDVEPPDTAERYRRLAADEGNGWRLPASDAFLTQWGVNDHELAHWVGPRLCDFPVRCQTEAVDYATEALDAVRKVYIRHTDPPLPSLEQSCQRAVGRGWDTHDLTCGHDMMLTAPTATAGLLDQIAHRSRPVSQ